MHRHIRRGLVFLLLAAAFGGCWYWRLPRSAAGPEAVWRFHLQPTPGLPEQDALTQTRATLKRRLEMMGLGGASVEAAGNSELIVRLPPGEGKARLLRKLATTGLLEIYRLYPVVSPRNHAGIYRMTSGRAEDEPRYRFFSVASGAKVSVQVVLNNSVLAYDNRGIDSVVQALPDAATREPVVILRLTLDAKRAFSDHIGGSSTGPLAVVMDGSILAVLPADTDLTGDGIRLAGVALTMEEARCLATVIRTGPLTASLRLAPTISPAPAQVDGLKR